MKTNTYLYSISLLAITFIVHIQSSTLECFRQNEGFCIQCIPGLHLYQGSCFQDIPNCLKYRIGAYCSQCIEGYVVDEQQKCVEETVNEVEQKKYGTKIIDLDNIQQEALVDQNSFIEWTAISGIDGFIRNVKLSFINEEQAILQGVQFRTYADSQTHIVLQYSHFKTFYQGVFNQIVPGSIYEEISWKSIQQLTIFYPNSTQQVEEQGKNLTTGQDNGNLSGIDQILNEGQENQTILQNKQQKELNEQKNLHADDEANNMDKDQSTEKKFDTENFLLNFPQLHPKPHLKDTDILS